MATPSGTPELKGATPEHDYIDTPDFSSLEVSTSEEDDDVILDTEILLSSSSQPTISHFGSSEHMVCSPPPLYFLFGMLSAVITILPKKVGSPNNDVHTRYAQHAINLYNMLHPSSTLLSRVYSFVKFYTTWKAKDNPNEN